MLCWIKKRKYVPFARYLALKRCGSIFVKIRKYNLLTEAKYDRYNEVLRLDIIDLQYSDIENKKLYYSKYYDHREMDATRKRVRRLDKIAFRAC
jgi:hypothetical protein